jgi:hypothetical protein
MHDVPLVNGPVAVRGAAELEPHPRRPADPRPEPQRFGRPCRPGRASDPDRPSMAVAGKRTRYPAPNSLEVVPPEGRTATSTVSCPG